MSTSNAITQDVELFNKFPMFWVKTKVEMAMQEDWYDGRYDKFYQKHLPIMNYQAYLHSINQMASGSIVPDVKLGHKYIEICYSYLDSLVA